MRDSKETRSRRTKTAAVIAVLILLTVAGAAAAPRASNAYRRLKIFAKVLSSLERFYVEPVNGDDLVEKATRGMVASLDPHSSFLDPEELELLTGDTTGRFGGVGLEVGVQDEMLTVIAPIPGSPAEEAGIETGYQIVAIEGASTVTMGIDDAVRIMRGEPGTEVTATFRGGPTKRPFDVTFTRRVIQVESVQLEMIAPGFPWIRVRSFQDGTADEVEAALEEARHAGKRQVDLSGVLLDLRHNPGGVLQEAVRVSDLFLARGVIVTTRRRHDRILHEYRANERGTLPPVPVVVLIDEASASAAEIVAGALKDHDRSLVVGHRSFGKGSVQSIIELGDGYGLKLTAARYYTPSGRSIQVLGIRPDIAVEKRPPSDSAPHAVGEPGLAEGDLPGHLTGAEPSDETEPPSLSDDDQLRVGFELLRGLSRTGGIGGPSTTASD